jgi:hypothetical protein
VLRLSRSRVICDIEFIIKNQGPAVGKRRWTSKGAECSVDRHNFAGEVYSFHVDILQVRLPATGAPKWKLLIVGEFWQGGDGESIHSTKWIKLLHGKPGDVLKWISANRVTVVPSAGEEVKSSNA